MVIRPPQRAVSRFYFFFGPCTFFFAPPLKFVLIFMSLLLVTMGLSRL